MTMEVIYDTGIVLEDQNRLLEQYKGEDDPQNMILALETQLQYLEDVFHQLLTQRDINTAIGAQLDQIGVIVGIARTTSDDDIYRLEIKAKIVKNISEGAPEQLISVFKFMTNASLVIYQEAFPAVVIMGSDGEIPPGLTNANPLYDLIQQSAPAGVEVDWLQLFDPVNPFSFDGTLDIGSGFGSIATPSAGGLFAGLLFRYDPFSFDGDDTTTRGFGSVRLGDPLVGGNFVGL